MGQNVSTNEIAGFLNQLYLCLWSKLMKQLDVIMNSWKFKIDENFFQKLGGHGQKRGWSFWSWDSEIVSISKTNSFNKLIFCVPVQIQED